MKLPLTAALLLALCFGQSCASEDVQLDVDFRKEGKTLVIENRNPFDYQDLDAVVNEKYHYRVASLKGKQVLRVPLDSFMTKQGTRFSSSTSKLSSMSLHAVTADEGVVTVE